MQSILRSLEQQRDRLRAAAPASKPFPRIVIPGSGAPPPVLRNVHGPARPLLLPDGRQPSQWDEIYWLAGQSDGDYLATLEGRAEIIRVTDGVVRTCAFEDIKKWHTVGRVAREDQ